MKTTQTEEIPLQEKEKRLENPPMVPFLKLLSFASTSDKILMIIGAFAAFCNGSAFPLFSLLFGNMTDSFAPTATDETVLEQAGMNSIWFTVVGIGTMILSFVMFATWMITGERQAIEFRKNYFSKILSQEIGWFDTINPNELASKVANETFSVQGAIGEKVPTFIMTFSMTFFGFVIGFSRGWQLAIVITTTLPIMSISAALMTIIMQSEQTKSTAGYSNAGATAEQAINAIKTVKMLDGEDFECEKYGKHLAEAAKVTIKYGAFTGFAMGLVFCVMMLSYALGFWYGSKLIADQTENNNTSEPYTAGDVLVIFFSILTGGFSLGQAGPCVKNFAQGKVAAVNIFAVLERTPSIQTPPNPKRIGHLKGEIRFNDVKFTYPSRQNMQILRGLNIIIPKGKKIALVGESGCGKSTVMQLVERFYDPDEGQVLIDDIDIRELDLDEIRGHIGYVGQEPVLFATSIRENLLYGKKTATEEEMIQVLKEANAWDFVQHLDKGLDTYVGIGGGQLSGGQKQRLAIARALLKRPQILLLDEATSALDRTNELLIQKTLDEVSKNITTIVIAHRLSTIQNADIIYVIDQGVCVEQGTHEKLINSHGKYEALAKNQFAAIQEQAPQEDNQDDQKNQINGQIDQQSPIKIQAIVSPLIDNKPTEIIPKLIEEGQKLQEFNRIRNESKDKINTQKINQVGQNEVILDLTQKDKAQQNNPLQQKDDEYLSRLFAYNQEERGIFYLGLLASAANGCAFPIFSLFLSEMINVLSSSNPKYYSPDIRNQKMDEVKEKSDMLVIWFVVIAFSTQILWTIQGGLLTVVAEKLTFKIRRDTYRKLLRMPIPFFDIPKNNAGTLTSRLSVDAKLINSLTSTVVGVNIMNFSSLICGMVIAFVASWALTLVSLGLSPLVFIGGLLQIKFMQGFSDLSDAAYKDSSNLIMEAVCNIRTVQSFGNQDIIMSIYERKVEEPMNRAKKKGVMSGLAFGFSQMQMFIIYAIVFYVGALLHKYQGLSVVDMFKSIFGIMFATMGMGNNQHFAGDVGAAKNAAKNIFEILDAQDEFQIEESNGRKRIKTKMTGQIELKNISFKYESRDKNLFNDLNLTVPQGFKVSLVGPSGCGKSTIMQMLMRFYDPIGGEILVDGINILDYDIRHLRRQFAIVSQEPTLFNCTIKENILYNENATQEQIEQAAKQANAYDFIVKNQFEENGAQNQVVIGSGFGRQVGPKGSQISGGQKQRIAISRAILRQSNILLLDEATSALDNTSEQLVQESLNRLMENKTTIAIAHRISTIKDSQIIYVFEEGKIVEQGTYQELVALKGFFYRLEQGIAQ